MTHWIRAAGLFAAPLGILTVLLAVLILRAAWHASKGRAGDGATGSATVEGGAAILFWGFVAAILGFLGQCAALYRMMATVVAAESVAPDLLAEGFAGSFVTTLWGVGLLLLSGLVWLPLRWLARGRALAGTLAVLFLFGVFGCAQGGSPAPADITRGVWAGSAGGDTFLFDLRGAPPDSLVGTVHVMHGGTMDSELAITSASYHAPDLVMFIESTNATYTGRIDLDRGRVSGGLTFGGRPGAQMELHWLDPTGLPGFAARLVEGPYVYRQPEDGIDGWRTATPEEVGLDRGAVEALVEAVACDQAGLIHSLQLVRHGKLVVDEYFHGYGPDDLHRLASTTKSIASLLVGAAIDRGLIKSVDEPVLRLLHESAPATGSRWGEERLADLLTMSMGLDWSPAEAASVHGTGTAFFREVLARKIVASPGTEWDYVSANVNLLAGIIFNATGRHAEAFAREVLFAPLGISSYDWDYGKDAGYNLMDGSLQLRPRDLAKIGAMVAANGSWNGEQVVSRGWIEESTGTHMATGQLPALGGYGYLWWTGRFPTRDDAEPIIVANGKGSQFIVIFPELDMVVVTTGGNDDNGRHLDIGRVLGTTLLSSM
jgi:CubicO group peptidase (beta-lactamase class C family)